MVNLQRNKSQGQVVIEIVQRKITEKQLTLKRTEIRRGRRLDMERFEERVFVNVRQMLNGC